MGSDWIMDPILHLVERSSGIIDPTLGSTDMSAQVLHRRPRARCSPHTLPDTSIVASERLAGQALTLTLADTPPPAGRATAVESYSGGV